MGVKDELAWRHPFPESGIAPRVLGEVTPSQEEINKARLNRKISRASATLLPIKSVGVMGDKQIHGQVNALRAIKTIGTPVPYVEIKRIPSRIINEIKVSREVYNVNTKPPLK